MWYAVIVSKTGELFSVGTILGDSLPSGMEAMELGEKFEQRDDKIWDTKKRIFVDAPVPTTKDRIDAIISQINTLPTSDKSLLLSKLK